MKSSVLIVEDEARIRDIVRDYFAAHGLDCDLARDGEEALDLLRDHDYDAILLDIFMPHLDGFEVCAAVRRNSQVPSLFLTALGGEEGMLRGYALGCDDYVTKPFSLAVLLAKTQAADPPEPGRASGTAHLRSDHSGYRQPALYGKWSASEAPAPGLRPSVLPAAQPGTGALPESASGQGLGAGLRRR